MWEKENMEKRAQQSSNVYLTGTLVTFFVTRGIISRKQKTDRVKGNNVSKRKNSSIEVV